MDKENQLGASLAGRGCHARLKTVVVSLLVLQTCIAFAYATPAPLQQCIPDGDSVLQGVTAGSERSLTDRTHHYEHYLTATHFCREHTHVSDEATLHAQSTLYLPTRIDHSSNNTKCQIPCWVSISPWPGWPLYHKAVNESISHQSDRYAGTAFLHCHPRTRTALHKGIHDTSRVSPLTQLKRQHMTTRFNKGKAVAERQTAGKEELAACNDNSFRSKYDLKLLAGLQYTHKNISGAQMEPSVADPDWWTQRVMFSDIADTQTGAQQGLSNCRKFFVKCVVDSNPKVEIAVPDNKAYVDPRAKGRIILKPTLNSDAAAAFIAEYDVRGSALTDLTICNPQGRTFVGAPTARLHSEGKVKNSQKVSMAAYVEITEGDDSRKKLPERVADLHKIFMKTAYQDLHNQYAQGKSLNHLLAQQHIKKKEHQLQCSILINLSPSYAYGSIVHANCDTHVQCHVTQVKMANIFVGEPEAVAANMAIAHPVLQAMEVLDVWGKGAGHITITAATDQGAEILRFAPYITFGVTGKFLVHLTMESGQTDPTLKFSVVSSSITGASFSANIMHAHIQSIHEQAMLHATQLCKAQLITTAREDVKIYFFDDNNEVVDISDADLDTASICFTPRNECMQYMPNGLVQEKAASAGGLKAMLKPADQLSAVLVLTASADKKKTLVLDGKPVMYTTGHRSVAGNTMPTGAQPSRLTATVAALAMARGKAPIAAELDLLYNPSQGKQLVFLLQEAWRMMPKQAIEARKAPPADDSPDFLGEALQASPAAVKKDLKRTRAEVSTLHTHKKGALHVETWSHIHVHSGTCTVLNTDEDMQISAIMHVLIPAPRLNLTPSCKDMSWTWYNAARMVNHSGCLTRQQPQQQPKCWKKPWPALPGAHLEQLHMGTMYNNLPRGYPLGPSWPMLHSALHKRMVQLQEKMLKMTTTWWHNAGEQQQMPPWPHTNTTATFTVTAMFLHTWRVYGDDPHIAENARHYWHLHYHTPHFTTKTVAFTNWHLSQTAMVQDQMINSARIWGWSLCVVEHLEVMFAPVLHFGALCAMDQLLCLDLIGSLRLLTILVAAQVFSIVSFIVLLSNV